MSTAVGEKARAQQNCRIEGEALGLVILKHPPKPRQKPVSRTEVQTAEAADSVVPKDVAPRRGIPIVVFSKRVFEMRAALDEWQDRRNDERAWRAIRAMACQQLAATRGPAWQRAFYRWVRNWVPSPLWSPEMADRLDELVREVEEQPRGYSLAELGQICNVTQVLAMRLNLKQLAPCDITGEELLAFRAQRQKVADRERKAAKRRQAGMKPQAESAARLKPWLRLGISKATYYRIPENERETLLKAVSNGARETDLSGPNIKKKDSTRTKESHGPAGALDIGRVGGAMPPTATSGIDTYFSGQRSRAHLAIVSLPSFRKFGAHIRREA